MQKRRAGVIINISTCAAFEPDPVFPTSGVFRAGLTAYAKLFADRYAAENIRMNNVLSGFIDSLPEKEEFRGRIPMGRYGRTDEVSALSASSPRTAPARSPGRTSASTAGSRATSDGRRTI
jgi:NAD(P)-dependent dehydrogenase (short-subunit alcohol dehydrogenase family)